MVNLLSDSRCTRVAGRAFSKCPHSDRNMWPRPPFGGPGSRMSVVAVFQKRFPVGASKGEAAATNLSTFLRGLFAGHVVCKSRSCTAGCISRSTAPWCWTGYLCDPLRATLICIRFRLLTISSNGERSALPSGLSSGGAIMVKSALC